MKNNWLAKILLSPFSLIFASIISLRNIFYEAGLLKATSFNIPIINVGNLSLGGTGKTPHIEYLIKLLSPFLKVGTLSRGYKRKSKGFRMVRSNDNANMSGDEPLQFKSKFPTVPVAVSESRNIGIPLLIKNHPDIKCILLDDAFQHRSVIPGLNILLTQYDDLFVDDMLMPSGRLREPKSSYSRADIIVVTKCPEDLSEEERNSKLNKIKPYPYQKLFFSKYKYGSPYYILDKDITINLYPELKVHTVSAIANSDYMIEYLERSCSIESIIKFEDHHYFSDHEMEHFNKIYVNNPKDNIIFLTTEKDAMRLLIHKEYILANNLPIFVLPITVEFMNEDKEAFDDCIKHFLLNFKT